MAYGVGRGAAAHLVLVVEMLLTEQLSSHDNIRARSFCFRADLAQFDHGTCAVRHEQSFGA